MAGNGTIGLEILEDLPDVDAVVIPYGGGGLTTGIASALRARRPRTRDLHGRARDAAPRSAAARAAGEPVAIDYVPSFVDGSGSRGVLDDDVAARRAADRRRARRDASTETAAAVRLLAERLRVIAEGAGALATAAALAGRAGGGRDRRGRLRRQHRLRDARPHPQRRDTDMSDSTDPTRTTRPRCSPAPATSDYERYLRTDELLALQKTPQEWVHRDELLFRPCTRARSCG